MKNKIISIMVIADVAGIMASDSLEGNLYLFDDNKVNGSFGHGTDKLTTKVIYDPDKESITLLWNIISNVPELFATIVQIEADKKYLDGKKYYYDDSDITYWKGTISKWVGQLSYNLIIRVGNRDLDFSCNLNLIVDSK
jgi:hypothetical protein